MKPLLSLTCLLGSVMLGSGAFASGDQLFNLSGFPKEERTRIQPEYWPSAVGEAAVCMWKDDKLAAYSITIDDNNASNVDWWLETAAKHGEPLTWFLITGEIGIKKSVRGTWDQWAHVSQLGHAIESHTVTHLSGASQPDTWKGLEWDYADAQLQIVAGIPGRKAWFLAYPGGGNAKLNDPLVAAKFYMAARGSKGMPNGASDIDYMSVNAMTKFHFGDRSGGWSNLNNLLDPSLYDGKHYGGWAVLVYHYVKPPYETVLPLLDFCAANRDRLWSGLFGDVARYGQERDTSALSVKENASARIVLSLTDRMDDRYYDFPLTVKVRLPDGWSTLTAKQDGKPAPSRIVEHQGARYALVDAVPDRGDVSLTPTH